jgi:hypothetical protein
MTYRLLFFCFAAMPLLLCSCAQHTITGSGSIGTAVRQVPTFSALDISIGANAVVSIQPGPVTVQISGYQNLLSYVQTKVEGNTLHITSQEGWNLNTDKQFKVQITVPSLNGIEVSGASQLAVHGNITGRELRMDISGAGEVSLDNCSVTKLSSGISGSGTVTIHSGAVQHAEYDISGSGDIQAFQMQTQETVASLSGSGTTEVSVQQKLAAHISGAGNVSYKGHPAISQDISGVGTVRDAN